MSSSNTSQEALEQEPLVTPSPQRDSPAAAASTNPPPPPRSSTASPSASPNVQPSVAVQQSTPPAVPVGQVMVPMPAPAQPVQYVAGQGGMVMMPQIQVC